MVLLDPHVNQRRLWWERLIWLLDLTAYLFLGVAGYAAAVDPSPYVVDTLNGMHWVIWLWGGLLFFGGVISFVGRLTRVWAIEYSANVLAGWGAALYVLILLPALTSGSELALAAVVYVAWAFVVRRYSELNIITNDPRRGSWRHRVKRAIRRRTANFVPREHH